jgi:RimJ/RimL family protein N-acetyltransferase
MTGEAEVDSADWQRRWTIDAGTVMLQPVTREIAEAVIGGEAITHDFEDGALHARTTQALGFAIRDIASGAAAALPTVWFIVRRADGRIIGDLGTHGPPDGAGSVEIGYTLAPSVRGQGIGTAAVAALLARLATVPGIRRVTAVTGADNTPSRRLLERQGFGLAGPLPGTAEVRYTLNLERTALPWAARSVACRIGREHEREVPGPARGAPAVPPAARQAGEPQQPLSRRRARL